MNIISSVDSVLPHQCQFTVKKIDQQSFWYIKMQRWFIWYEWTINMVRRGETNQVSAHRLSGMLCWHLIADQYQDWFWKSLSIKRRAAYSINLQQWSCANLVDLCYLPRYLLKLMHMIHLMLQKLRHLVSVNALLFLMGMPTYWLNPLVQFLRRAQNVSRSFC